MVTFRDAVAKPTGAVYPPPAQKTLDLLISFNTPYPGNKVIPTPLRLVNLSLNDKVVTEEETLNNFLTQVYPKLRPNYYGNVGLTYENIVSTDPSTESGIYNFYAVTNNDVTDIVPPGTAKPLNSVLTDLERTYNQYALMFIMDMFYKHKNDVYDNPHNTNATNLLDVWTDFFQAIYNQYTKLTNTPITLEAFIYDKTNSLINIATLDGYNTPAQILFVVPITVANAIISQHNLATDSSIHPSLQTSLSAETNLPIPTIYLTPTLFGYRYPVDVSGEGYYYKKSPLNATFPRINSTLVLEATVVMSAISGLNIVQLSSTKTADTLSIVRSYNSQTQTSSCTINLNISGTPYQLVLNSTANTILFALIYATTGLTISYVDQTGTTILQTLTIPNLSLDFDQIQIGIQVTPSGLNTLQALVVYPNILSNDQISLLFQTTIS